MGIRIIGGALKGKTLQSMPGREMRPTADRVRESIFNIIARRITGAHVLDLFAGTGAFGIEALSRNAARARFIDKSPHACGVIEKNIRACRLHDRADIIRWNICKNLNCLAVNKIVFDVVFMDPPYHQNCILPTLGSLQRCGALKNNALILAEHDLRDEIPTDSPLFVLTDQRKYRKTLVSFFEYVL